MYFFVFFIVFLLSYLLLVPSLALSNFFGAIDVPNDRKIHSDPTPRGGGFAIFIAFSLVLVIIPIGIDLKIPLLLGGTVVFLIGFLDDVINISPQIKLLGQSLAIFVYFLTSTLLGYQSSIWLSIILAIWIIFISNATNITDGLNGLASGIGVSEALCLAIVSLILEDTDTFLCVLLLLGAISGFLPHNFPRAKIFMGDCGSLFLGFVLAALSSRLIIKSNSVIYLLSILLIFRIPIYDTIISIIRRIIKGKHPFQADKEHFHHLLLQNDFTAECAALLLISASLLFGFFGVLLCWF